ncbi:hypothetical protein LCGC14_0721560 [marine sediment metagenome]|uniref:Uncharacterized protein n=1 Tax=marine sediment metagenome TaxID=412755 RepID=A0A0F9TJK2_9ZZZZ
MGIWQSQINDAAIGIGGAPWTARGIKTLASGVLDASDGPGRYIVASEAGATDALTQITGLAVGERIAIGPDTGDTITVTDGTNLLLAGVNFTMNHVDDTMDLEVKSAGVMKEIGRSSNN